MDFASTIHHARTSAGLSQADLAAKAECSIHAVWEVENRANGSVLLLERLVTALGLRFAGMGTGSSFGERVRTMRRRRGWSQETLAERAGVSVPAIIRLEKSNARI